ncbi:MAG: DNA polymerase III subunit alpha [Armatimonadota bacterium]
MQSSNFVHLHTHSEYSLLDGASRITDIIKKAIEYKMPAVALTDHAAMYGNIQFYSEAKEAGIKPILGCEVYVAPRTIHDRDVKLDRELHHLVLLAKNENGYKNLIKMVSIAWSEGIYYKPRVDKQILAEYSKDIIALTACIGGEVPYHILNNDITSAEQSLHDYMNIFGKENVYVEIQDHFLEEQKKVNKALIELANKNNLKIVCSNDSHYTNKEDANPHDVLLCIQTNSTLDQTDRFRFGSDEFYFKSETEMMELFNDIPYVLTNTLEVAERCNVKFDFDRSKLPNPGLPENIDPGEYMKREALKGLRERLGCEPPENYIKQLEYECEVINQAEFSVYMLIVRDFTDFARREGIYVGVRGSAAGSLVCYGLGITDVDPIEYFLTFERFLNPERKEMPDIDLDIQDNRRDELIKYVCDKYGKEHVGLIATFSSMKAKGAIRDCGRALAIDLPVVDKVAKMIPDLPVGLKIKDALEENPDLRSLYEKDEEIRKLIDTARTLEGVNRNSGVHAAGLLISDDPLTNHVPVQVGNKGEYIAQLGKKDIAKIGLLKMDFLGLANLTILAESVKKVKQNKGIDIDILKIPLDDAKTFEMLGRGDTNGVFQLESAGMRRNVIELKPTSVRELAAIVALYRPGPMENIPRFVKSKFGQEKIEYLHPDLEPILKETYGVICYQDQVLRIANVIAGFSLGQADILRKAMSSKNKAVMDQQREKFIEGAKNNGVSEKIAAKIYDQVQPFAGYAFNKAHAVCYAFVAYRTAFMKANYPLEYYSALISANMDDKKKLALYILDCKKIGIDVLPPDVNFSMVDFEPEGSNLRFGMGAIKGCSKAIIEAIVSAREECGQFTDLFDFCIKLSERTQLSKSTVENLIKVGAFGSIEKNRKMLLEMLPDAMNAAACKLKDKQNGQAGLFGDDDESCISTFDVSKYSYTKNFDKSEILAFEKDLMGLYFSGHPLDSVKDILENRISHNAITYTELKNDETCEIGGMIVDCRIIMTKRNEKMANIKIEDLYGNINVTFFPKSYKDYADYLEKDKIVLITGKALHKERIAQDDDDSIVEVDIIGESVREIAKNEIKNIQCLHIKIDNGNAKKLDFLKNLLCSNCGENPVILHVYNGKEKRRMNTDIKVNSTVKLMQEIENCLGKDTVRLI